MYDKSNNKYIIITCIIIGLIIAYAYLLSYRLQPKIIYLSECVPGKTNIQVELSGYLIYQFIISSNTKIDIKNHKIKIDIQYSDDANSNVMNNIHKYVEGYKWKECHYWTNIINHINQIKLQQKYAYYITDKIYDGDITVSKRNINIYLDNNLTNKIILWCETWRQQFNSENSLSDSNLLNTRIISKKK